MNELKTIKRNFYISDFEDEQAFLTSLHANGWRLKSIKGNKYTFERCDKEPFSYQIDFNPDKKQKSEYIQLFSDFGWQFIIEKDNRFYFSKPTSQHNENKIFSDRETKAFMCSKIIKHKLYQLIPVSVIMLVISYVMWLIMFKYKTFPLAVTFFVSLILLGGLILTLYSTKYLAGFLKVKKIIKESI